MFLVQYALLQITYSPWLLICTPRSLVSDLAALFWQSRGLFCFPSNSPTRWIDALLGYFTFEECGDMTNPTLGLELGETYLFVQRDRSNWFHPMGFSYFPDGAHADKDELEPTITQTGSNCAETFSCPTPRYFKNGVFLGEVGTENFGLDNYEPDFFLSPDWYAGFYSVELTFDDEDYKKDFFYFCHVSGQHCVDWNS